jgi:RNA polymerase sigma factor (sigma-70 family)
MRAFLELHAALILRLARGVVRDRGDRVEPEDVAQEVVATLLQLHRGGTFDPARVENIEAYMRVVVRRAAHRARTRRGMLERLAADGDLTGIAEGEGRVDVEAAPTPEDAAERAIDRRRILEAVKARLRPRDALAFALLVEEGLAIEEVARRLGTTANNVYQMRHRILAAARQVEEEAREDGATRKDEAAVLDSQRGAT